MTLGVAYVSAYCWDWYTSQIEATNWYVLLIHINIWLQDNLDLSMFTFIEPFGDFHKNIGADILLPILLIGHVIAAIYHTQRTKRKIDDTI